VKAQFPSALGDPLEYNRIILQGLRSISGLKSLANRMCNSYLVWMALGDLLIYLYMVVNCVQLVGNLEAANVFVLP
jgi:hypothetical protein